LQLCNGVTAEAWRGFSSHCVRVTRPLRALNV
jgi:hypothetical protein